MKKFFDGDPRDRTAVEAQAKRCELHLFRATNEKNEPFFVYAVLTPEQRIEIEGKIEANAPVNLEDYHMIYRELGDQPTPEVAANIQRHFEKHYKHPWENREHAFVRPTNWGALFQQWDNDRAADSTISENEPSAQP